MRSYLDSPRPRASAACSAGLRGRRARAVPRQHSGHRGRARARSSPARPSRSPARRLTSRRPRRRATKASTASPASPPARTPEREKATSGNNCGRRRRQRRDTQGLTSCDGGQLSEVVTVRVVRGRLRDRNANIGTAITTARCGNSAVRARPYELARLTARPSATARAADRAGRRSCRTRPAPAARIAPSSRPRIRCRFPQRQRVSANNFQIDGTSVNSLTHGGAAVITPKESVKEVRVIANNYSADSGATPARRC